MKDISNDPTPESKKPSGSSVPKKGQFIVIEVPSNPLDTSYPKAIFACETLEEAMKLSKQMNADAGSERYGVQRPATPHK